MLFCNRNGMNVKFSVFSVKLEEYRSSLKKRKIFEKNLELKRTSLELSKNGLRMFLRHLVDRFLSFHTPSHVFFKILKID